ncbi:MAG TPA: DNA repair protein RadA [Bacillota bacterium]|nr:DNA repair protein RadA [Clostridiaceae bacterium]HNR03700.1 DNA repair protein RadA [Bacillota bacterium]HNT04168.1 DNA repair protein RadA [Bacillota bacterium]HPW41396.1 DNA repair protein RadA [Bacillota bacterium]HPX69370.1 DNA repair protein RadA [Bacillota bacterium]
MAKIRTKFVCSECGSESPKWMGKCPECGQWNTLVEEVEQRDSQAQQSFAGILSKPESLLDISEDIEERLSTGSYELDRVLGGGIVKGSLVLVGGDPGIGKSTLLLQIANNIGNNGKKVLYVSGEESTAQIKLRAFRMGIRSGNIFLVSENNTQNVDIYVRDMKPDILVVDSIQTMYSPVITSAPGSVSQVREATLGLMKIAKQDGIATFIVGHVTKQGAIAGPRVLEHMVDTVLYFEGETHMSYRVLRAVKNRYGSTNEIGIFEMGDKGLTEVPNPSEMLLSGRMEGATGSCVISAMEGTRAMLVEVQALLSHTGFGVPRRNATGVDYNRVALLMAVLEKRVGMQLGSSDSYVNVVGGIKLNEPAADLGIVAAIASSFRDREIDGSTVIIGEVGLAGEVRAVNFAEKRVNEAAKLGFKRCIIPANNLSRLNDKSGIEVLGVSNVNNMLDIIIGG